MKLRLQIKENVLGKIFIFYFLILISCLMAAEGIFCAETEEKFVYDSKGKRDPFVPLITGEVKFGGVGLEGVETVDDITLEGIVWDPKGNSMAILNGVILKEYETAGNVKITKIEPKRIKVLINEEEFTIELIKEETSYKEKEGRMSDYKD